MFLKFLLFLEIFLCLKTLNFRIFFTIFNYLYFHKFNLFLVFICTSLFGNFHLKEVPERNTAKKSLKSAKMAQKLIL